MCLACDGSASGKSLQNFFIRNLVAINYQEERKHIKDKQLLHDEIIQ